VGDHLVDGELSIGDFVLAGGEAAALVVIEAVTRLVPSVLGNEASVTEESFADGLLEYPQYTRPAEFRGWGVPRSCARATTPRWPAGGCADARAHARAPSRPGRCPWGLGPEEVLLLLEQGEVEVLARHGYDVESGKSVRVEARIPCIPPKSSTATPCATTFRLPPR